MVSFVHKDAFHPEWSLIRQTGWKSSVSEIKDDIDFYQHKHVVDSFFRGPCQFRISGKRLQLLATDAFRIARAEQKLAEAPTS